MNKAGLLVVAIAAGYILFELSMLHRLGYRMEPDYILEQMASAAEAMALCGAPSRGQSDTYQVKFDRVKLRSLKQRGETGPQREPEQLAAELASELAAVRAQVGELVQSLGCEDQAVSTLLRRFSIYAGRS